MVMVLYVWHWKWITLLFQRQQRSTSKEVLLKTIKISIVMIWWLWPSVTFTHHVLGLYTSSRSPQSPILHSCSCLTCHGGWSGQIQWQSRCYFCTDQWCYGWNQEGMLTASTLHWFCAWALSLGRVLVYNTNPVSLKEQATPPNYFLSFYCCVVVILNTGRVVMWFVKASNTLRFYKLSVFCLKHCFEASHMLTAAKCGNVR
jgi:hypothetical protein